MRSTYRQPQEHSYLYTAVVSNLFWRIPPLLILKIFIPPMYELNLTKHTDCLIFFRRRNNPSKVNLYGYTNPHVAIPGECGERMWGIYTMPPTRLVAPDVYIRS